MASINEKAAAWLREIEAYNTHSFKLDQKQTALLIIDMQNFFVHETGPAYLPDSQYTIKNIQELQKAFRTKNLPIIFTSHVHKSPEYDGGNLTWWWAEYCKEGSKDAEIFEAIRPAKGEKLIHKHRYSAFEGTDMEITLRTLGIRDLVVTGVMTNLCCETTARYAFNKDYRVQFVCDATATANEDLHVAALKNIAFGFAPVVLSKDVIDQLR
ncbi:MAG: isochorismatase family protein [candidate division Zixibacteria bacterium]|nr:isochorismatase family protein [candidate division Zixibacteria bacterium]NIR66632.1 isochorismatase family protein [candidate division Zixibacteria bacterium]NIS14763.1 isochorismatase family protein [candidate division Zixibacteria bacterium]NIS48192.1 isochorismatase family protein [candidate division Zixibacteria bacterium]NIT51305.1 isochorismatase family protein [candidate division Zixibacteria bacterium]